MQAEIERQLQRTPDWEKIMVDFSMSGGTGTNLPIAGDGDVFAQGGASMTPQPPTPIDTLGPSVATGPSMPATPPPSFSPGATPSSTLDNITQMLGAGGPPQRLVVPTATNEFGVRLKSPGFSTSLHEPNSREFQQELIDNAQLANQTFLQNKMTEQQNLQEQMRARAGQPTQFSSMNNTNFGLFPNINSTGPGQYSMNSYPLVASSQYENPDNPQSKIDAMTAALLKKGNGLPINWPGTP